MPTYKINHPKINGTLTIKRDTPLTETELDEILQQATGETPAPPPIAPQALPKRATTMESLGQGILSGAHGLGIGAQQLGVGVAKLFSDSPRLNTLTQQLENEEAQRRMTYDQIQAETGKERGFLNPASWGQFLGETAPALALPVTALEGAAVKGAATLAPKLGAPAINVLGKAAVGGTTGGALGAAQPTLENESRLARTVGGAVVGAAVPTALAGAKKGWEAIRNTGTADDIIDRSLARVGVKPTVKRGEGAETIRVQKEQARDAVKDIVDNRRIFKFGEGEEEVVGHLPQNVAEFSQAVSQLKKNIFTQYDDLLKNAEATGGDAAKIELKPVVDELNKVLDDDVFRLHADKSSRIALGNLIKSYEGMEKLSLSKAQDVIADLNQRLATYSKNPSVDKASLANAYSKIVGVLRKSVDDTVNNLEGPGYQQLKNRYGALSSLESKVAKRAAALEGAPTTGEEILRPGYAEIKGIYGLMRGNPATVGAAALAKAAAQANKTRLHQDRLVKNMFSQLADLSAPRNESPARKFVEQAVKEGMKRTTPVTISGVAAPDSEQSSTGAY